MTDVEELGLSFLGLGHVAVRTDEPDLVPWLLDALTPWFAPLRPEGAEVEVVVSRHPAIDRPSDPPVQVATFALERSVVHLPAWRLDDDTTVLEDERFGVRYRVGPRRIDIAPAGETMLRGGPFVIVRELALARTLRREHIQLHAAGVVANGAAVLIAGPSGGGKTTTLLHLVSQPGASLLANDRVVVWRGADGWHAHGVPTLVRVRASTLPLLGARAAGLVPGAWSTLTRREMAERLAAGQGPPSVGAAGSVAVTLPQLADALQSTAAPTAPLTSIVLIHVDDATVGHARSAVPAGRAAARLDDVLFGRSTAPRPRTVFEPAGGPVSPGAGAEVARLGREVPVHELRVGPRFLHDDAAAEDLLGALTSG